MLPGVSVLRMKTWKSASFAAAIMLVSGLAAAEPVLILDDPGGDVVDYLDRADKWTGEEQEVIIVGSCDSACTLYLMSPYTCAQASARLGFHAPHDENANDRADDRVSRYLLSLYPPKVLAWIEKHGGLKEELIYLEGAELVRTVKMCR
jgi:hypothetical protein